MERQHYKFQNKVEEDGWGAGGNFGTLITVDSDCITVNEGVQKTGLSKSGKQWGRWENHATFFSMRSGRLKIYSASKIKGRGRIFRDQTAGYFSLPQSHKWSPYKSAVAETFWPEFAAMMNRNGVAVDEGELDFKGVQRLAYPVLSLKDEWRAVQGISAGLRSSDIRGLVEGSLGKSRYRKDVAKAVVNSTSLNGLAVASSLKTVVPVDWLIPVIASFRHEIMWNRDEFRALMTRLPDHQKRLLLADMGNTQPNGVRTMWITDSLRSIHQMPPGDLPRATTWREFHDILVPRARALGSYRENQEIPQKGVSKKLDGLTTAGLELRSAKDTHELVRWGEEMSHCIGSYGGDAVRGASHLFGLFEGEKMIANLEVAPGGRVRQFYGRFNERPSEKITKPVVDAIARRMRKKVEA